MSGQNVAQTCFKLIFFFCEVNKSKVFHASRNIQLLRAYLDAKFSYHNLLQYLSEFLDNKRQGLSNNFITHMNLFVHFYCYKFLFGNEIFYEANCRKFIYQLNQDIYKTKVIIKCRRLVIPLYQNFLSLHLNFGVKWLFNLFS